MSSNPYSLISLGEHSLKIDKDITEIQKIIIHYGYKILMETDKIIVLIRSLKDKGKGIEPSEKEKELEKDKEKTSEVQNKSIGIILQHLEKLKIPKGYKGNE